MTLIMACLSRVTKLFVDDWGFAVAVVAWLSVAGWALPRLAGAATWSPVLLFLGLAAILLIGTHQAAAQQRLPPQIKEVASRQSIHRAIVETLTRRGGYIFIGCEQQSRLH